MLENKGIGGTSSGVFSACAEQMVAPDAALVVIEFTVNDKADLRLADPQRRGYEQLVRKLLRLPGAPAVVQVRRSGGDKWSHGGQRGGLAGWAAQCWLSQAASVTAKLSQRDSGVASERCEWPSHPDTAVPPALPHPPTPARPSHLLLSHSSTTTLGGVRSAMALTMGSSTTHRPRSTTPCSHT